MGGLKSGSLPGVIFFSKLDSIRSIEDSVYKFIKPDAYVRL